MDLYLCHTTKIIIAEFFSGQTVVVSTAHTPIISSSNSLSKNSSTNNHSRTEENEEETQNQAEEVVTSDPNIEYVKPKKVLVRSGPDDLWLVEEKNSSGLSTGTHLLTLILKMKKKKTFFCVCLLIYDKRCV